MNDYIPLTELGKHIHGIDSGDTVYIASDIFRMAAICRANQEIFNFNDLIDALQEKVGVSGTLLFPTFNWDFCNGKGFDYYKSTSRTGALSNIALQRADFKRTKHPIYSFAVWGQDADLLVSLKNYDSFGEDSPFGYLEKKKSKYLAIGLPPCSGFTYIHYLEQLAHVPFRYFKTFTGNYTDENGNVSQRNYTMYVRDLTINPMVYNGWKYLDCELRNKSALHEQTINGIPIGIIDIQKAHDILLHEIIENKCEKLYRFEGNNPYE